MIRRYALDLTMALCESASTYMCVYIQYKSPCFPKRGIYSYKYLIPSIHPGNGS